MLGSFGSSSSTTNSSPHPQEEEQQQDPPPPPPPPPDILHHHHQIVQQSFTSTSIYKRQLLITCADLISRSDYPAAHRLLTLLSSTSSPLGDSTERLVHQFTKALSLRLSTTNAASTTTDNETLLRSSSYLSLNQITPFIRFSHLTANQAILEAIDGHQSVHVIDFDIMHGLQWPPFMQAIAERYPPPTLKITTLGPDLQTLIRTGDRLTKFAHSLNLNFHFHPLLVNNETEIIPPDIIIDPNETLVVNLVMYLHRLLNNPDKIHHFLHKIKSMNPRVVTLAEREGGHHHPAFLQRFVDALGHYKAVFDSLEATLPPNSAERLAVEQGWLGREIAEIVAAEGGGGGGRRREGLRWWEVVMRGTGFRNVSLSGFAVAQAKMLLRLHYPSEGYHLHAMNDSLFLGWQNQPLFSVSSWL